MANNKTEPTMKYKYLRRWWGFKYYVGTVLICLRHVAGPLIISLGCFGLLFNWSQSYVADHSLVFYFFDALAQLALSCLGMAAFLISILEFGYRWRVAK